MFSRNSEEGSKLTKTDMDDKLLAQVEPAIKADKDLVVL